jgi:large subunit ribosomal protein L13
MATQTKSYRIRASDLSPTWRVVDAKDKTLGRISTEIAILLQGKHKPTYVPYLNSGDFVVVVNVEKIRVTGNKLNQKMYYRHSGYHGGLKKETLAVLLKRTPERAVRHAVKGMLPKNSLGRRMLSRLKLYAGDTHPHGAQLNARPKPVLQTADVQDSSGARATSVTRKPTPSRKKKSSTVNPLTKEMKATQKVNVSLTKSEVGDEAVAETSLSEIVVEDKRAKRPKSTRTNGESDTVSKTKSSRSVSNPDSKVMAEEPASTGSDIKNDKPTQRRQSPDT